MYIIDRWQWRATRRRGKLHARQLIETHGVRAFFRAHEDAWHALDEGHTPKARFHQAGCYAISRHLQRRAVLEAVFAPQGGRQAESKDAMGVVEAQLLRDFA